jgi:NMD protein affecting ribosome stability and mRNA decay
MSNTLCVRCGASISGVWHIDSVTGRAVCVDCYEHDLCDC